MRGEKIMGSITEMAEKVTTLLETYNYYPRLECVSGYPVASTEAVATIGDQPFINFSSNNYLDICNHPKIIEAAVAALKKFGIGAGGSRLTAGTQDPHVQLEAKIAEFKGREDAVVFSSGYLANNGIIPALIGVTLKGVIAMLQGGAEEPTLEIFSDKLVHASILDGLAIASSKIFKKEFRISRYAHRDMEELEGLLVNSKAERKLIITDGVFSLHGRIAPLKRIVALARQFKAEIYVDDAHGTGVFGAKGRGTAELLGVEDEIDFQVGTLSKALGGAGGFITGSHNFCQYIRVAARTHVFQTSMPPSVAAGLIVAFDIIRDEPERRTVLLENAAKLRAEILCLGFDIFDAETQIIPIRFGDEAKAKHATQGLWEKGIFAPCYYYPAVGQTEAMVRVNLTFGHTTEHIERLLTSLSHIGKELDVIK